MDAKRSRVRRLRMTKREGERSFGMTLEQPKFRLHMQFPSVSYVSPQLAADRAGIKPGWIVRSVGCQCVQGRTVTEVASLFRGVVEVEIEIEDMSYMDSNNQATTTAASLEQSADRNPFDPFQARPAPSATGSAAAPFSNVPSRAISNASDNAQANSAPISSSVPPLPGYSAATMKTAVVSASASFASNVVTQSIQVLDANMVGSQSMPKPPAPQVTQSIQMPAPQLPAKQAHSVPNEQPTAAQPTPTAQSVPAPAPVARQATLAQQPASPHTMPNAKAEMATAPAPQTVQQPAIQQTTPIPVAKPIAVSKATNEQPLTSQVKQPASALSQKVSTVAQPAATSKPAMESIKPPATKQAAPPVLRLAAPAPSNVQAKQPVMPKPHVAVPQQRVLSSQHHVNGLHVSQNPAHQSATPSQQAAPVQRTAKEIDGKKPTPAAATANGLKSPQKASAMTKQPVVATRPAATASPTRTAHGVLSTSVEFPAEHKESKKRSRRESVDTTTPRSQSKQARNKRNFIDDSSDLEDVPDEEELETRGRSRRSRRLASETGRQRQSVVVQRLITSGFTAEDAQASVDACGHDQEKCMVWIISLMEEREFTKQLNMASIESEQSKRNEEKELKKIESETLKKATAFASLFPTSFILQRDVGTTDFNTLLHTTMGTVSGDCLMRVLFTKLLKLESQAIRWYKESAKCYMLQMAERLEAALGSHDVLSCCAEAKTAGQCGFVSALQEEERLLTKTLFEMPENHGGVPLQFLQADEAMQFSLEDDGFEVLDHVDETLVD